MTHYHDVFWEHYDQVWKDSRLSWDEADYGGVGVLRVESDIFWKPDMVLNNK